jgi:hypothetical protein
MGDARHFAEQRYPGDPLALLRWWCDASEGAAGQLAGLLAEVVELRELNVRLADRLAACSEVLGRAAERGKVCGCQVGERDGPNGCR